MNDSIHELAQRRYSCRQYLDRALEGADRRKLAGRLETLGAGPFGNRPRFALVAATESDRAPLRGLGTYGFIKGAAGFIVGAVGSSHGDLEDYGYCLELAVLEATDLGLGTCWLGGSFTKSSFANRIGATGGEVVPAVVSVGHPTDESRSHWIRRRAGSEQRLPPEGLFLAGGLDTPLDGTGVGDYAEVLEAVRWAPSASNRQPWRLVRCNDTWHFYLQRTKGYNKGVVASLLKIADLQRVDMGIAMCHFDLAARERGLTGRWSEAQPRPAAAWPELEYTLSWVPEGR